MLKTISDTLENKLNGLYYGNRILLPFSCCILKIVIEDDILMDFSPSSKSIFLNETDAYTEIYFKDFKNLKDIISKYEAVKIIAVEKNKDIFQMENHIKLALRVQENHKLIIEKTDEDILFLE
ncbi:MAG: hypothetical protein ACYDA4_12835 [Ignavibacteriaceae bacterium]